MQDILNVSIPDKILPLVILLKREFSSAGRITGRPDHPKELFGLILYFLPKYLLFQEGHAFRIQICYLNISKYWRYIEIVVFHVVVRHLKSLRTPDLK
jgi:hypothetical protein